MKLGEIRKAKEIGYEGRKSYIWHACEGCGRERWVRITHGEPEHSLCYYCARTIVGMDLEKRVRQLEESIASLKSMIRRRV